MHVSIHFFTIIFHTGVYHFINFHMEVEHI